MILKNGKIPENSFVALRTDWSKRWPSQEKLVNTHYVSLLLNYCLLRLFLKIRPPVIAEIITAVGLSYLLMRY